MMWTEKLDSAFARGVSPVRAVGNWLRLIALWRRRARSRRALSTLDPRMLRDIGIDRLDADQEARKPFWRG